MEILAAPLFSVVLFESIADRISPPVEVPYFHAVIYTTRSCHIWHRGAIYRIRGQEYISNRAALGGGLINRRPKTQIESGAFCFALPLAPKTIKFLRVPHPCRVLCDRVGILTFCRMLVWVCRLAGARPERNAPQHPITLSTPLVPFLARRGHLRDQGSGLHWQSSSTWGRADQQTSWDSN